MQTLLPREVIVVDDGSDDATVEIALAQRALLAPVDLIVLRQNNLGAGSARNRALAVARSEFIAFLDADDEWLPRKLELSFERLIVSNAILVAHNGWLVYEGKETYLDIAGRFHAAARDPMHGLYRRGFISTSSVLTRREAIADVGGFDERLRTGQDFDLWLKMLCRAEVVYDIFDAPLTRYHIRSGSITKNTARRLDNTLTIAERHAQTLRVHTERYFSSLCFRILAVHLEAIAAYRGSGRPLAAACTAASIPYQITRSTLRSAGLSTGLFVLWVICAFFAYLVQFHEFIFPVLKLFGIS